MVMPLVPMAMMALIVIIVAIMVAIIIMRAPAIVTPVIMVSPPVTIAPMIAIPVVPIIIAIADLQLHRREQGDFVGMNQRRSDQQYRKCQQSRFQRCHK
ncbi:hypothetical protein SP68_18460 [Klebsiella variicola]|nr:hypothetical protein KR75_11830 [Klebsiella variicola]AJE91141.2 hypothetical protein SP68_18460 [Klebsiella variicola]KHE28229.1 hypothetical protein JG24_29435 [Klebsiella variicola]